MQTTEKEPPILVAEFASARQLWEAVGALDERRIGRDFIGVLISDDGHEANGQRALHLLSVLAPSRLHEEIRDAFARHGAAAVGRAKEMASRHGTIPHPGALEDHDMKLPMGLEYPAARRDGVRS